MTEAYTSLPNNLRYYGRVEDGKVVEYGSQVPFNFDLVMRTNRFTKASEFKARIESWINAMPKGEGIEANWVVSRLVFHMKTCIPHEIHNRIVIFIVGKS